MNLCFVVLVVAMPLLHFALAEMDDIEQTGTQILNIAETEEHDENNRKERGLLGLFNKKPAAQPTLGFNVGGYGAANGGSAYGRDAPYSGVKTSHAAYGHGHGHGHGHGYGSNRGSGYGTGRSYQQSIDIFFMNERTQLPASANCPAYRLSSNLLVQCRENQCEVSCPEQYSFPNGATLLKVLCISGKWIIRDSEFTTIPACQATCTPPCENNGICVEAGICKCPQNFYGPWCQNKKTICVGKPSVPRNSRVSCTNNVCNAECMNGFQYPDGSTITNLECVDGIWLHKKSNTPKPPDCAPICQPPCQNDGQCISFNICQCAKQYRGDYCQYSVQACNVTKTEFNGNYKCNYDGLEARCKLMCPSLPGLKVQGSLDIEYACNYGVGEFYPQPLPKCIYPPEYIIHKGPQSEYYSNNRGPTNGGGGVVVFTQWTTQRELIEAILAKYQDITHRSELWSPEETPVSSSSYTLYTEGDIDVSIDRTARPALCTTWGGINMKTFDGLVFKAPLSCSHTLINDKVDATFDITLRACPYGSGYGCAHSLQIYWQSIPYTLDNINGTVHLSTPTKKLPLPVQVMGMKIIPVAQHLQILLESVDLRIDWDRHQYLGLYAGPLLWSKVGGLCGSLDGDYRNDLMAKSGVVVETVKSFTDSWRVDDKSDLCIMENSREPDFGVDSCELVKQKRAVEVCSRLLSNKKLANCLKDKQFEQILRACIADYCNCPHREHPESCNCDTLSMLAQECVFKGVKLEHGWRDLNICPVNCSYGRVYLPCGPDVEPTCDMSVTPNKEKCNEGCFCPEGTVQYKDACITQELCPCTMRGKEFKPESKIKKNCNTCTCNGGQWKCTDELCGARCGAIGDPHYQTFDGKRYDFMGQCSYYLLKTAKLSVEAENVACSGAISENLNLVSSSDNPSCTKSVTLRFALKNGVPTTVRLGQGMIVHVNEKEVTKFPKVIGTGEVLMRLASSSFMTVEFPDGIRIWWDGDSRVYIDAPPTYRNQTAGLCGTFNSNTQDDFLTPEGDIETAVEPFADKWRTKDTCDFPTDTVPGPHPCSVNPDKRDVAEEYCKWIMDDIFQDCHWTVEPEQYYENCLYDVCACKENPEKCFCPILASYGTECMRQGIKTGWRMAVKECAVKCPMGQVFDECGDTCARTCSDLATKNTCQKECIEGCRCPHGEYLNDKNECVPQQKCTCVYDGVTFKPGYKEVRPGEKFLDLCTCTNGLWECDDAEPGDELKYPPASQRRAECANQPFAEFSKCAPKEPKTCKNMHEIVENFEDCVQDCVCMAGYVYDTSRKVCVLPENCSCHHGGKSYSDGDQIKDDCNQCICKSGNWSCSTHGCGSTCSVWGDSHFTTYDNHDFDFQGACDYVLSKGVADNGDGFAVTIQNVLCGTMGVTCSKSLEISLSGSVQDSLTLTSDASYTIDPNKSTIKKIRDASNSKGHGVFHIYKAGVFIVVDIIPLKLQVKWDEGTRVYVKLGNEWKNKVMGLCGNYNDNAVDDMQTPSQGIETSPLVFGHAWKVQPFCIQPTAPIDACREHPERETWAQLKCGVLKSEIFKDCHAEVSVEKYLKRCIFDTCACDQGGDCECLCTAVAAYAHACSQKGINIRWRTPHFCPMQCDPHCAEYKACTPACAVETCDNFLDQGLTERMCNQENCLEGCAIKPCEEGKIYLNDTYKECVPKADCKPVCLLRDGHTYYEGDVMYEDECATCFCSKKKEVCSGVKCKLANSTEHPHIIGLGSTTQRPMGTDTQPKCVRGWTRWFDKDTDTSGKLIHLNDEEKLPRYNRMESIYATCQKQYMKKIECRVVNTHESPDYMDENVRCNLQDGLVCQGQCHDYELRVYCQCDDENIKPPTITEKPQIGQPCDAVIAEYKEYPGNCHKFLHCQPTNDGSGWTYVEKTCGEYMMFNPTLNVCDHIATVQEIKSSCAIVDQPKECADGQVLVECANQCENTCNYYGSILQKRGLCKKGEHCKPGCVAKNRPDCRSLGKYWRDENTCVEIDECPCMDKWEAYARPHMPLIGADEVCQCINNAYTCVPNQLPDVTTLPPLLTTTAAPSEDGLGPLPPTLAPHLYCESESFIPLIQGDEPLPDSIFSASSTLNNKATPSMARLPSSLKDSVGSWSPSIDDQTQYLQISFSAPEPVFGIVVAGSPDFDYYVTLFKILYSHDGESYHYLIDETDTPQKFNGPLDSRTPQKTLFSIPVEAKSFRIYPLKWHGHIAIRAELLGCGEPDTTTFLDTTTEAKKENFILGTTTKPNNLQNECKCMDHMGVDNGKMYPKQVKASSIWELPHPAKKPHLIDLLKLSSPVGWRPVANTPKEYVQFDFLAPQNISGFITKGGPDGWVTSYTVMFSKNNQIWNKLLFFDGQPEQFRGNYDSNSEVINTFRSPLLTQYCKIVPSKWEGNINMRIEPVGCFKPYPVIKEEEPKVDKVPSKCLTCQGITADPTTPGGLCKCKNGLLWDGHNCVQSNLCPCVEEYSSYPIGTKYVNKECRECVCVLGGHPNCKPKKCPPCVETNLRSVVTPDCSCKCEPCPKYQRICPSSGDCIPELLWCNGVQDCADDEDASCKNIFEVTTQQTPVNNGPEIIKCPEPQCPPNMKLKILEKKERKMSQMFTKSYTDTENIGGNIVKVTKTNVFVSETEEFLMMPTVQVGGVEEEACSEFTCVPIPTKVITRNQTVICVDPKCPENYEIELDMSNAKPGECPRYMCVLKPTKDDACEISGKFVTTFDGTEFKYETCSHILARDIKNSNWLITVQLLCEDDVRKVCHKMITIKDFESDAVLTIMPNMKLNFNNHEYTVSQLINSPICKAAFVISQLGETVLVVSRKHGYWVHYNDIGYIKIGISSKYLRTVDGLCGYYDGKKQNDKRTPDGTLILSTEKFGDSWFDKKIPKEMCHPQTCPFDLQSKALTLCNAIKHPVFVKCKKAVNSKQFVSKCMETTCECLRAHPGEDTTCKCNVLEDFVAKCLTVRPDTQLSLWRPIQECEISCPAPLIHSDCYKRRCEPSCATLNSDDCPIIPDACFPGCYCPEGTVRLGKKCVTLAECKDCSCNSFGKSQFFTYDKRDFHFNGNCTYLLSRDIVLPGLYNFQVYVTMDHCKRLGYTDNTTQESCIKAFHIFNGDHLIHIERPKVGKVPRILIDGTEEKVPFKKSWISLREVNGKELLLSLLESHLDLRVSYDDLAYTLSVPSIKYSGKMEGLCGDCDHNPKNDLIENPAKKKGPTPSSDLAEVLQSWQAAEPKLGADLQVCSSEKIPQNECLPVPPEKDPCLLLYNEEFFGQCSTIIDPDKYIALCQKELCKPGNQRQAACNFMSAYAHECAQQGICLNWRHPDLCPFDCPTDMVYQSCGCAATCDTIKALHDYDALNMKTNKFVKTLTTNDMCLPEERFEGCFCPKGKVMENGECVTEGSCVKCDDLVHAPGEKWNKNKCTNCSCNLEGKVECVEQKCLIEENICAAGFTPKKIDLADVCCPRYRCVPEPTQPPSKLCLEPLVPICGPGQFKKQITGSNGCPQLICECKPKEECKQLQLPRALKPGEKVVLENLGCCPTQEIVCDISTCPPILKECAERFFEVVRKQELGDCCPHYVCEPPKDMCIVQNGQGENFIKPLNAKWPHPTDPCKQETCAYGPSGSTQVITTTETCDSSCPSGFFYENKQAALKCCGECVQQKCILDKQLYEENAIWTSADNCTIYSCVRKGESLIISSMQESCPDVSACPENLLVPSEGGCCKLCKNEPPAEEQRNCLPVSLAEPLTVELIEIENPGVGKCVNKETIKGFTECDGACPSGFKYNKEAATHEKHCLCCSVEGWKSVTVPLVCENGSKIVEKVDVPASCGCKTCELSDVADKIDPRFDMLAKIVSGQIAALNS